VWYSADGSTWHQVLASAPWASRIGPVATVLQGGHQVQNREALLLFGGYAYPDTNFTPLSAAPLSSNESGHSTQTPHWAAAAWASADGVRWVQLDPEKMAWTPGTMHAALAAAPCSAGGPSRGARPFGSGDPTCAFAAGGLLNEGYYDNTVHKLQLPTAVWDSDSETSLGVERPLAGLNSSSPSEGISLAVAGEVGGKFLEALLADEVLAMKVVVGVMAAACCLRRRTGIQGAQDRSPQDPLVRCLSLSVLGLGVLVLVVAGIAAAAIQHLYREVEVLRSEAPRCRVDGETTSLLWDALGLAKASERLDQFNTLLRLASR
ncbi:unnamed protein product, partial [Polarella glacialis]